MLSNEHYTNFFLENFPQLCIGLGEKNWGPTEEWLPIDKVWIPGHAGLANHIARHTLDHGFDPAFSHQLELDHGIMTVYYELDHDMKLPLVPIVQNCAVPPLVPVRRAYEFGKALGRRHPRPTPGWSGSPSSAPAVCRTGSATRASVTSTRSSTAGSCERLERGELDQVLDMPDSEIELAGNGNHEMRRWLAVAGAMAPARADDPRLRTGLPVDHRHGRRRVGDRRSAAQQTSATVGAAGDPTRGVTDMTRAGRRTSPATSRPPRSACAT